MTKTKASLEEWRKEYECHPEPDPWRVAGWELDERGKPSKWQEHIEVPTGHYRRCGPGNYELDQEYEQKAEAARSRLADALKALDASNENYVIRVRPEMLIEGDFEREVVTVTVRCRVRWCENAEIAARYGQFEQHTMAKVDQEFARIFRTGDLNGLR